MWVSSCQERAWFRIGDKNTLSPCSGSYAGSSSLDQSQLKAELSEVKTALAEEKAHKDLLAVLFTLTATLSPPP